MRGVPVVLAVLGGLLLCGATVAAWVVEVDARDVAGIPLQDIRSQPGTAFAPAAVPLGLAAIVAGVLAGVPGRVGRVVAVAVVVLGTGSAAVWAVGWSRAAAATGGLQPAVQAAGAGALAVLAAGVLRLLPARRPRAGAGGAASSGPDRGGAPSRYTVEGLGVADGDDGEWVAAAVEEER